LIVYYTFHVHILGKTHLVLYNMYLQPLSQAPQNTIYNMRLTHPNRVIKKLLNWFQFLYNTVYFKIMTSVQLKINYKMPLSVKALQLNHTQVQRVNKTAMCCQMCCVICTTVCNLNMCDGKITFSVKVELSAIEMHSCRILKRC